MSEFFISTIIYNKVRSYIYAGLKYFLKIFFLFLSFGLKNLFYKIKKFDFYYMPDLKFLYFLFKKFDLSYTSD